jgi:hypothetical protein
MFNTPAAVTAHPNAIASLVTTAVAGVLYQYAHQWGWVNFTVEDGILVVGGLNTLVHFVGKRGIWPTIQAVWSGAVVGRAPTP